MNNQTSIYQTPYVYVRHWEIPMVEINTFQAEGTALRRYSLVVSRK